MSSLENLKSVVLKLQGPLPDYLKDLIDKKVAELDTFTKELPTRYTYREPETGEYLCVETDFEEWREIIKLDFSKFALRHFTDIRDLLDDNAPKE
ncbi:MAG: hypothetical protein KKG00_06220, partial [Bacteroidetes bacterium]|nr:hypothetical protein [Bacteroidota bacterium]